MTADTAQQEAQAALRATSTDTLLDSIIRLTHVVHSDDMREGGSLKNRAAREGHTRDLRAQRDLIRAEILRRTGDA